MRLFKKTFISLSLVLLIFTTGTGCYFLKIFKPGENALTVSPSSGKVPIAWGSSEHSDIAFLKLPIELPGIEHTFYMQFDTGSPTTYFRKNRLESIQDRFPDFQLSVDSLTESASLSFDLGNMRVSSPNFTLRNRNTPPIDWTDSTQTILLGTIGSDLIEKSIGIIDFKNGYCQFEKVLPAEYEHAQFSKFKFRMRRTLFPARIEGKYYDLMHDTGTSGFELISSKGFSKSMALENAAPEVGFEVRSHDKILMAYNLETKSQIDFEMASVGLTKVSYIEGAAFWQVALMRMLRMGGMIGNEIFRDKILILDGNRKLFSILD